jgi:hypothetical protein
VVNYVAKTNLPFNLDMFNPLLLIKDFNSAGPIKTDMKFMSNADVPFLALENQIENARNPWTGNLITSDDKKSPLFVTFSGGAHRGDPNATSLSFDLEKSYYIHDNIFDEKNWTRADRWQE